MCDPLTAISATLGVVNYLGGKAAAEASYESNAQMAQLQYQQIGEKQEQINDQSALDKTERIKQGMLERAKISTIAGESGALGLSSERLLADSFMQEGTDISSMEKNRQNALKQTGWEGKQAQARAEAGNTEAAAKSPSLIGTGLQIGGDIYTGTQKAKERAKSKTEVKT